jgi:integrase
VRQRQEIGPLRIHLGRWQSCAGFSRCLGQYECGSEGSVFLHDFRRSAIRNMIRAGVSEKTAMQISGHATRSVFDRYDIGSDADLADAADRIENRRKLVTETSDAERSEASR